MRFAYRDITSLISAVRTLCRARPSRLKIEYL
jgi:hypothetical protein